MVEKSALDVVLNIEPGDEVVETVRKTFASSGHSVSFVIAAGEIEDAEIRVLRSSGGVSSERTSLVWSGPSDLVSLVGTITPSEVALRVSIARETGQGHEVRGGILVRAVAVSVQGSLRSLAAPAPQHVAAPAPAVVTVSPPRTSRDIRERTEAGRSTQRQLIGDDSTGEGSASADARRGRGSPRLPRGKRRGHAFPLRAMHRALFGR